MEGCLGVYMFDSIQGLLCYSEGRRLCQHLSVACLHAHRFACVSLPACVCVCACSESGANYEPSCMKDLQRSLLEHFKHQRLKEGKKKKITNLKCVTLVRTQKREISSAHFSNLFYLRIHLVISM